MRISESCILTGRGNYRRNLRLVAAPAQGSQAHVVALRQCGAGGVPLMPATNASKVHGLRRLVMSALYGARAQAKRDVFGIAVVLALSACAKDLFLRSART